MKFWVFELENELLFYFADVDSRPPPIIHHGPQNQTLPLTSPAFLRCAASGDPAPLIRWYKNGRILSARDPRLTIHDSGTLQIQGGNRICKFTSLASTLVFHPSAQTSIRPLGSRPPQLLRGCHSEGEGAPTFHPSLRHRFRLCFYTCISTQLIYSDNC